MMFMKHPKEPPEGLYKTLQGHTKMLDWIQDRLLLLEDKLDDRLEDKAPAPTTKDKTDGRNTKMKNKDKYRTASERATAYDAFCSSRTCSSCPAATDDMGCQFEWLELDAEPERYLQFEFVPFAICEELELRKPVYCALQSAVRERFGTAEELVVFLRTENVRVSVQAEDDKGRSRVVLDRFAVLDERTGGFVPAYVGYLVKKTA